MENKQGRFIRKWKNIRKLGKWRFIFIHGSLIWGIITALLSRLIFDILDQNLALSNFVDPSYLLRFFVSIFVFMIMGIPFGFWLWKENEKRFQKLTEY